MKCSSVFFNILEQLSESFLRSYPLSLKLEVVDLQVSALLRVSVAVILVIIVEFWLS